LAENTGQSLEKVERDTERDYFMSGEEARDYGIIDSLVSRNIITGGSR
jgi:ATP-dependent Clp protease protease subunit